MRAAWWAVGMLGLTMLTFEPSAVADGVGVACCACTFCSGPTFCGDGIIGQSACDTFCNGGGMCEFHTPVADTACRDVPVCPQFVPPAAGAPAMSAPVQLLLLAGLAAFGYATLTHRS